MEKEPRGAYQPAEQPEQTPENDCAVASVPQESFTGAGELQRVEVHDPLLPPRDLAERDPRLIELLSLLYQSHNLQRKLVDAAIASVPQEDQPSSPTQAIERRDPLQNIDPPFVDRYLRASLLTEAAVHIMRGSFTGYPVEPASLRDTLNPALAYYGYEVVEGEAPPLSDADTITPFYSADPQDEEYEKRLWDQEKAYDKSRRRLFFYEEGPADQQPKGIPDNLLYIYPTQQGTYEAVRALADHPEVQRILGVLGTVDVLREQMPYAGFGLDKIEFTPDADTPEGLEATWQYRYKYAKEILERVHDVLMEGFHAHDYSGAGDRVKVAALVFDLNEALREANLRIDVLPGWQPGERVSLPGMMKVPEGAVKIEEVSDQENAR